MDDPPIQRRWPCSSRASWPNDSDMSSSSFPLDLLDGDLGGPGDGEWSEGSVSLGMIGDEILGFLSTPLPFSGVDVDARPGNANPLGDLFKASTMGATCLNTSSICNNRASSS